MGSYGVRSGDCIRIDKLCLLDAVDSARPRWQVGKRDYPPAICCDPERYSGIAAATGDAIGHHHVPQFECSIPKWENQKRNKKGGIEVPHVPHKLTPQFHPSKKKRPLVSDLVSEPVLFGSENSFPVIMAVVPAVPCPNYMEVYSWDPTPSKVSAWRVSQCLQVRVVVGMSFLWGIQGGFHADLMGDFMGIYLYMIGIQCGWWSCDVMYPPVSSLPWKISHLLRCSHQNISKPPCIQHVQLPCLTSRW